MPRHTAAQQKALDLAAFVNGQFKTPVLTMASDPKYVVKYLPTGLLPFDIMLKGGLPRNRFVEIYGDSSTLKSYVGLSAIATTQRAGGVCALIDTEHAFDPEWATTIGVRCEDLLLGDELETGEQFFDTVEALVRANIDLIVFDSIGALLPQAHREKRLHKENPKIAALASLMSVAMRKLVAGNKTTSILFVNQLRTNVGVTFGNPNTPTGGRSLPYYAAMRLGIRKMGWVTEAVQRWDGTKMVDSKLRVGQTFNVSVDKSKLNVPHRELMFEWSHKTGNIDPVKFLISQGIELGLVEQKGQASWRIVGGRQSVVGRAKFEQFVAQNPAALSHLEKVVRAYHGLLPPQPSPRSSPPSRQSSKPQRAHHSRRLGRASSNGAG